MKTLCDLMPRAVAFGQSAGLIDTDSSFLPWPEVATRVKRLARALVRSGVQPGDRVCVLHPRSTASCIAVHATLHAAGIVVPLDPFGPPEALTAVIDATEPAAIIGAAQTITRRIAEYVPTSTETVVYTGEADALLALGITAERLISFDGAIADADDATTNLQPLPEPQPDDPAYIIFTSGSTGAPKGIVHTHKSGLAYAEMGARAHTMTAADRLAAISPLHFDQSTLDLYSVPWAGASAVAISEAELRFPASLSKRLDGDAVSMIYTTPYQLLQLAQRGDLENRSLGSLRQIAFGGEAFAPGVLVAMARTYPPAELLNVYGPAEVNGVTVHSFGVRPGHIEQVSIGLPCAGVELVIVDDADQLVAPGDSGEILVNSPTMMAGYWRREDLDAECFVERDGTRFYRTGDMAHVDRDGLLQFEGRRDNRIKVRGVRIELEEIERVLEDAPGVAHAVAGRVDDADGMQHIAGWVVPESDRDVDHQLLEAWCRERLPTNAVPTSFMEISNLPTTATGKIDRATLRASAASLARDEDNR